MYTPGEIVKAGIELLDHIRAGVGYPEDKLTAIADYLIAGEGWQPASTAPKEVEVLTYRKAGRDGALGRDPLEAPWTRPQLRALIEVMG